MCHHKRSILEKMKNSNQCSKNFINSGIRKSSRLMTVRTKILLWNILTYFCPKNRKNHFIMLGKIFFFARFRSKLADRSINSPNNNSISSYTALDKWLKRIFCGEGKKDNWVTVNFCNGMQISTHQTHIDQALNDTTILIQIEW